MSISRFFHNVRNILAGQPPLDDNFDQGRGKLQGTTAVQAAGVAFGTIDDPDKVKRGPQKGPRSRQAA